MFILLQQHWSDCSGILKHTGHIRKTSIAVYHMASNDNLNGDMNTEQVPESTGSLSKEQTDEKATEKKPGLNISLFKLFSFADTLDSVLMFVGTIAAIGNGFCMPLMALLFGDLVDSIGKNGSTTVVVHGVFKVYIVFLSISLISLYLNHICILTCGGNEFFQLGITRMWNWQTCQLYLQVSLKFVYLAMGAGVASFFRKFMVELSMYFYWNSRMFKENLINDCVFSVL